MPYTAQLVDQTWQILADTFSAPVRAEVARIVGQDKTELAATFYRFMLEDDGAKPFLSVTTVEARLKPGLQRWMQVLFGHTSRDELAGALALQRHVGEVQDRKSVV